MRTYEHLLYPIFLIAIGIITLTGVNLFGSAILEGAAWKQNVILALLLIFGMLPPSVRDTKAAWSIAGYALAFFMFGGANIIGTVGTMLGLEKIVIAVLVLFMSYRLWAETWHTNKTYMLAPIIAIIFTGLLLPIQDQNIIGSSVDALINWDSSNFTSDKGFHIYLGITGIFAGITEMLIQTNAAKQLSKVTDTGKDTI